MSPSKFQVRNVVQFWGFPFCTELRYEYLNCADLCHLLRSKNGLPLDKVCIHDILVVLLPLSSPRNPVFLGEGW